MDDGEGEGGTGGAMAFPNGYVYSYGVSSRPSSLVSIGGVKRGEEERERKRRDEGNEVLTRFRSFFLVGAGSPRDG